MRVSLRATQRGIIIEKQENEIQKFKDENKLLKSNNIGVIAKTKAHNEHGAGRKKDSESKKKK